MDKHTDTPILLEELVGLQRMTRTQRREICGITQKPKEPPPGTPAPTSHVRAVKKRRTSAKQAAVDHDVAPPVDSRYYGQAFEKLMGEITSSCCSDELPCGLRVWAKIPGWCHCPAVMWSVEHCQRAQVPAVVKSHVPGRVLVLYYGDHTYSWVPASDVSPLSVAQEERERAMRAFAREKNKHAMVIRALNELAASCADPQDELARMKRVWQFAAMGQHEWQDVCCLCREADAEITCRHCQRQYHALCVTPRSLSKAHMPHGMGWTCPCCGEQTHVGQAVVEVIDGVEVNVAEEEMKERMGLTPDWIVHTAAMHVFQLPSPTPATPYIKGLLDPCTNSKVAPNIPAEKLYDKHDDGLKLTNSWTGYYIVLNPEFKSQIQWRFVNRAIDEVESGSVPAVILICRNSTDTAYFQRLRPYPRVMLKRSSARFKDYDKTPIGFGIAVFCIAKTDNMALFKRFFEGFGGAGEPNIPFDKVFLESPEFPALLTRLRAFAEQHHRDHWVQCSACSKWRIISYAQALELKDADDDEEWTCAQLDPPHSSCATAQTRAEIEGVHYATSRDGEQHMTGIAIWDQPVQQSTNHCPNASSMTMQDVMAVSGIDDVIAVSGIAKNDQFPEGTTHASSSHAQPMPGLAIRFGSVGSSNDAQNCSDQASPGTGAISQSIQTSYTSSDDSGPAAVAAEDLMHRTAVGGPACGTVPVHLVSVSSEPAVAPAEINPSAVVCHVVGVHSSNACKSGMPVNAGLAVPDSTALSLSAPANVDTCRNHNPATVVNSDSSGHHAQQFPSNVHGHTNCKNHLAQHSKDIENGQPPASCSSQQPTSLAQIDAELSEAAASACQETLARLTSMPLRPNYMSHPGQVQGADRTKASREEEPAELLTGIELARQARIAANRSLLAGLGLGPNAMHQGALPAVPPNDPLVRQAAKQLALRTAMSQAERQQAFAQKHLDRVLMDVAVRRAQLLAQLRELDQAESHARSTVDMAARAVEELANEQQLA